MLCVFCTQYSIIYQHLPTSVECHSIWIPTMDQFDWYVRYFCNTKREHLLWHWKFLYKWITLCMVVWTSKLEFFGSSSLHSVDLKCKFVAWLVHEKVRVVSVGVYLPGCSVWKNGTLRFPVFAFCFCVCYSHKLSLPRVAIVIFMPRGKAIFDR